MPSSAAPPPCPVPVCSSVGTQGDPSHVQVLRGQCRPLGPRGCAVTGGVLDHSPTALPRPQGLGASQARCGQCDPWILNSTDTFPQLWGETQDQTLHCPDPSALQSGKPRVRRSLHRSRIPRTHCAGTVGAGCGGTDTRSRRVSKILDPTPVFPRTTSGLHFH